MIVFPNCKINLGLHVVKKRTDSFHDLETIFYPVGIHDALEVIHDPLPDANGCRFAVSGLSIVGNISDNICVKAYHLLKKDFPQLPSLQMHLHKTIPAGAGLGGGSADGAFTLKLLNKMFDLNISEDNLILYALLLGSDCPFFIVNKPCYATGRGEVMEPVILDLSEYRLMLVTPPVHVNTGWAFSQIKPSGGRQSLRETIGLPVPQWKDALQNDFENAICQKYPQIKAIKDTLYDSGALYASMSGSGSTIFGIFPKSTPVPAFQDDYFVKVI